MPDLDAVKAKITHIEHQNTGLSGHLNKGTRNWLDDRPYRHQLDLNAKNMKPHMAAARLADSSKARLSPLIDLSTSVSFGSAGGSAGSSLLQSPGSPGVTYSGANLAGLSPIRPLPGPRDATGHQMQKGRALPNPKPLSPTDKRWHASVNPTQSSASLPMPWMKKSHGVFNTGTTKPGTNDKSTFDSYDRGSDRPLMWGVPRERISLVETEMSLRMRSAGLEATRLREEAEEHAQRVRRMNHLQMREWHRMQCMESKQHTRELMERAGQARISTGLKMLPRIRCAHCNQFKHTKCWCAFCGRADPFY